MTINNDSENNYFFLNEYTPPKKILDFKDLPEGWHYGEGFPITEKVIKKAITIDKEAFNNCFFETDAFPGINGEIMVTIYYRDYCLEFTIENNGSVTYIREHNDKEVSYEENITFSEALNRIKTFKEEIWNSSKFLTEYIGTKGENGLEVWLSETQLEEESLSSIVLVYYEKVEPFANISSTTIEKVPQQLLLTGESL